MRNVDAHSSHDGFDCGRERESESDNASERRSLKNRKKKVWEIDVCSSSPASPSCLYFYFYFDSYCCPVSVIALSYVWMCDGSSAEPDHGRDYYGTVRAMRAMMVMMLHRVMMASVIVSSPSCDPSSSSYPYPCPSGLGTKESQVRAYCDQSRQCNNTNNGGGASKITLKCVVGLKSGSLR